MESVDILILILCGLLVVLNTAIVISNKGKRWGLALTGILFALAPMISIVVRYW
jgi:hypothetical protein